MVDVFNAGLGIMNAIICSSRKAICNLSQFLVVYVHRHSHDVCYMWYMVIYKFILGYKSQCSKNVLLNVHFEGQL